MRKLITLLAIIVPFLVSCKHEVYYNIITKVQPDGAGSIMMSPSSDQVQVGASVTFTAKPNDYWAFDHWEGSITGTDNPAHLTVSDYTSVKAVFVENDPGIQYTETTHVLPEDVAKWLGLGWNIGNNLSAHNDGVSSETAWGHLPATQQLFNKVKEAGFTFVRIPITWIGHIGDAPDYKIDKQWLERVSDYVNYCEQAGLKAIINTHHDDCYWLNVKKAADDESENKKTCEELRAVWTQIARYFRDKGDFLIFEPFNEPSGGYYEGQTSLPDGGKQFNCIQEWNQVFIDAVRSTGGNNASRWLNVVGYGANPVYTLSHFEIPKDYVSNNRLIVAFHYYHAMPFGFDGITEWGHTARIPNWDIWDHDEVFMDGILAKLEEKFIKKGVPVCIDETGCATGWGERDKAFQLYYIEYLYKAAKTHHMAPAIWDNGTTTIPGDNYAFISHETGDFVLNGREVVSVMKRAVFDDSEEYTLQSIYDRAPFIDEVEVINVSIPDNQFKHYLLSRFDRNGDGEITYPENLSAIDISVTTDDITSMGGIEHLENLSSLVANGSARGMGKLASLDLSKNHQIQEVSILNNEVSVLNISGCEKLKRLLCWENRLTELDLSNCPNLEELCCAQNHLTSIDVSKCPKLRIFAPNENDLEELDLSNNPLLEEVEIYNNPRLKLVWLKKGQTIRHFMKDAFTEIRYKD